MVRVRVRLDQAKLERALADSPAVRAGMKKAATAVHVAAIRRALPHRDTGAYIRGLKVHELPRNSFRLTASAAHSNYVEWGTSARRSASAPTPTRTPQKRGIHPQLILTGAATDFRARE